MKKTFTQILYLLCLILLLVLPFFVFAATTAPLDYLTNVAEKGGYAENVGSNSFSQYLGLVIESILGILGVVFIVLMIYAGFKWMKASGREEEVKTAQDIIRRAIIGLILVVSSYAITNFVLRGLLG